MSKKHNWSKSKAIAARNNFKLNVERSSLPDDTRRSKRRNYAIRLCPLNHCFKEVKRLGNHLRQFHKLSNKKARKYVAKSVVALDPETSENSESESSVSSNEEEEDEREEEKLLSGYFSREIHRPNGDSFVYDSASDDDRDWLGERFFERHSNPGTSNNQLYQQEDNMECELEHTSDLHDENNELPVNFQSKINDDNDEEEDVDYEDGDDRFFISNKEEDDLLTGFVDWLCSPDGGKKPRRTAMKHKSVLMSIVRYDEEQSPDYKNIYNRSFLNGWIVKMESEEKQPGTIKTYLGAVLHFFNYIIITEIKEFDFNQIRKMETLIKQWRRNLWKGIEIRKHQKQLQDMSSFPMPEEISKLDKSEVMQDAISTLKRFSLSESTITKKAFALVRDYLLTRIIFDNASRPGAISNMTLSEFQGALVQEDGFVVRVLKHKTAHKGPANISMSQNVYTNVQRYIRFMRNKLPGIRSECNDPVFVSWGGGKMESNMITTQMNSFWYKIHGNSSRMNPTLVRKYTTTSIHQYNPELKKDTADLLCHSIRTAENNYVLVEKQMKASSTSKKIQAIQREQIKPKLIDEEILKEFEDEIAEECVTTAKVRDKFNETDCFSHMKDDKKEIKRVVDMVRYKIKQNREKEALVNEEEECTQEGVDVDDCSLVNMGKVKLQGNREKSEPSGIFQDEAQLHTGRRRTRFSETDLELIRKFLGDYINSDCSIIRSEFEIHVRSLPGLKNILEKYGINSLITKMRTERKFR